jgi:hypothetical protein
MLSGAMQIDYFSVNSAAKFVPDSSLIDPAQQTPTAFGGNEGESATPEIANQFTTNSHCLYNRYFVSGRHSERFGGSPSCVQSFLRNYGMHVRAATQRPKEAGA